MQRQHDAVDGHFGELRRRRLVANRGSPAPVDTDFSGARWTASFASSRFVFGGIDDLERRQHVVEILHLVVGASGATLLAKVLVDVAELTFFLGAEVLAQAENRQVDEIAPLDRRRHLAHHLATRKRLPIRLRYWCQLDVAQVLRPAMHAQRVVGRVDDVRRPGIEPHRNDRAPESVRSTDESDLFRGVHRRILAQLVQRHHVEGKNEVGLGLEACRQTQRCRRETHTQAQEIFLEDGFDRQVGVGLGDTRHGVVTRTAVASRLPRGVGALVAAG